MEPIITFYKHLRSTLRAQSVSAPLLIRYTQHYLIFNLFRCKWYVLIESVECK